MNDLYADSAQARALDRRMDGDDTHWAENVTPEQAAENNQAWLRSLRERDARQAVASRRAISGALAKMELICGTVAARRQA